MRQVQVPPDSHAISKQAGQLLTIEKAKLVELGTRDIRRFFKPGFVELKGKRHVHAGEVKPTCDQYVPQPDPTGVHASLKLSAAPAEMLGSNSASPIRSSSIQDFAVRSALK
jgi:hypothetical protein